MKVHQHFLLKQVKLCVIQKHLFPRKKIQIAKSFSVLGFKVKILEYSKDNKRNNKNSMKRNVMEISGL